ncbi:MAG TPA: glucokinase [Sandaracinaceae bacterium LLY-WYZ-13_1]|nr:glucokinase [Sandaracinaceae bacterium LLY-WYZ-13_1]
MRILAGDIGGTKTLLACYEGAPGALEEVGRARYASADHTGLAPILEDFLRERAPVEAAAFGIAGPVVDDTCKATNLPWVVDARALEAASALPRVRLLNDFAAVALGMNELRDDDLLVLQDRPIRADGPVAVLGAGTGLGQALLVPTGGPLPRVLATEGGHADFAPRDEIEIELLRFLWRRHGGRVSVERVVSGPGLVALHAFVVARGLAASTEAVEARLDAGEDAAAVIGEAGVAGTDPACRFALERFVSLYGAEAGNLALKSLPHGGLFVAGGIAPKIAPMLERGDFLAAFRAKGRMEPVLDRVPVRVVLDPEVGLLGARRAAAALASA